MSALTDYMRDVRAFLKSTDRTNGLDPRDMPAPKRRYVPDAIQRRDIVSTLRNAVPDIDAVSGLRAARSLGALRNDPFYRDAVRDYLTQASDGTAPDVAEPVPAPFSSRNHQSRVTRSRKGRTSFKVDRRGIAQVIGATDRVTAPYPSDEIDTVERGWLTASLDLVPRKGYGRSSLAIFRVTEARLARYDVPALLGTDLTAYASVIDGDVSDRSACAVQRCAISAGDCPTLERFVTPDAVYAANTRRTARFPVSRKRIQALTARLNDPSTVIVESVDVNGKETRRARFVPTVDHPRLATPSAFPLDGLAYGRCLTRTVRYVTPYDRTATREDVETVETVTLPATHRGYWSRGEWHSRVILPRRTVTRRRTRTVLNTRPSDVMWLGHTLTARGATSDRQSTARRASAERTAARVIGQVDAPSTVLGWEALADGVNRGEAVKVIYPSGLKRTLSRADDGRYALTLPDGTRIRERSAGALATRAA